MEHRLVPVILAGGEGTRLWPMSRAEWPKQFMVINGVLSPFQQTLQRVADASRYHPPVIVTNKAYRFVVAEQARAMSMIPGAILLEPEGRNTAPAIISAAVFVRDNFSGGDETLLHVLPSDHALIVNAAYLAAVEAAAEAAQTGHCLVTFGVTATRPETGYGYIEARGARPGMVSPVTRFVEKPDRGRAEAMLAAGGYVWNSGMFMFRTCDLLAECQALIPSAARSAINATATAHADRDFIWLEESAFTAAPDISIDRGVFERTTRASVVPVDMEWSDLGSWDAIWKAGQKDAAGNVVSGDATLSNTSRSLVLSEARHVAVEGLNDAAVIVAEDAVFVGKLSDAQAMSALVKRLKAHPRTAPLTQVGPRSHRPWGGFVTLLETERFKVKRLFVNPGKRLSLQRHQHRAEHWVVVRGTAEVTRADAVTQLGENQSAFIERGEVHCLANPGPDLLEVIEVQTGHYLGEDDIERLEDSFGRA